MCMELIHHLQTGSSDEDFYLIACLSTMLLQLTELFHNPVELTALV